MFLSAKNCRKVISWTGFGGQIQNVSAAKYSWLPNISESNQEIPPTRKAIVFLSQFTALI